MPESERLRGWQAEEDMVHVHKWNLSHIEEGHTAEGDRELTALLFGKTGQKTPCPPIHAKYYLQFFPISSCTFSKNVLQYHQTSS